MASLTRSIDRSVDLSRALAHVLEQRVRGARERYLERIRYAWRDAQAAARAPLTPIEAARQWRSYSVDFVQRSVLFWDTLRERGNRWLEHEAAGKPPVLAYEYEVLSDARSFENPANYALVRIVPPRDIVIDE